MSAAPATPGSGRPGKQSSERQVALARWMGLILIAGGGAAIAFGWSGMARVNCADCQLPYLLSGGAAGLALVIVGASLFVIAQLRSDRLRLEAQFAELAVALATAPRSVALPSRPATVALGAAGAAWVVEGELVVAGRSSFHRQSCRLVQGKAGTEVVAFGEAVARGLSPCRVCQPGGEPSARPAAEGTPPAEAGSGNGQDPAAELVPDPPTVSPEPIPHQAKTASDEPPPAASPVPVSDIWAEDDRPPPARPRGRRRAAAAAAGTASGLQDPVEAPPEEPPATDPDPLPAGRRSRRREGRAD
jgi:hypothetical protein